MWLMVWEREDDKEKERTESALESDLRWEERGCNLVTRDLYALHAVFEIPKKSVAGDLGVAIAREEDEDDR